MWLLASTFSTIMRLWFSVQYGKSSYCKRVKNNASSFSLSIKYNLQKSKDSSALAVDFIWDFTSWDFWLKKTSPQLSAQPETTEVSLYLLFHLEQPQGKESALPNPQLKHHIKISDLNGKSQREGKPASVNDFIVIQEGLAKRHRILWWQQKRDKHSKLPFVVPGSFFYAFRVIKQTYSERENGGLISVNWNCLHNCQMQCFASGRWRSLLYQDMF